jgi:hypothetical protein
VEYVREWLSEVSALEATAIGVLFVTSELRCALLSRDETALMMATVETWCGHALVENAPNRSPSQRDPVALRIPMDAIRTPCASTDNACPTMKATFSRLAAAIQIALQTSTVPPAIHSQEISCVTLKERSKFVVRSSRATTTALRNTNAWTCLSDPIDAVESTAFPRRRRFNTADAN